MRIAHAIHGLGLGGAQKVVASIVRGGQGADLQYFVYSSSDGVHRQEIEEAGAEVRVLKRSLPKLDPVWLFRLTGSMRKDRIDLVHAHLFGDSLHGYLAARLAGNLPVILTIHTMPEGWKRLQQYAYPWLIGRSVVSIACSRSVCRAIRKAHPNIAGKLQVIPNGIEPFEATRDVNSRLGALRQDLSIPDHAVVIGAIGRLVEPKGLTFLIQAFSTLRSRAPNLDIRLVLVGDGPLRQRLESQVSSEGNGDRIHFTGFRDDVRQIMQELDMVVFSSLYEGLPITLLEAMAAERCLICTNIPSFNDVVRQENEALIVPPGDPVSLAAALKRAVKDPDLRRRLGQRSAERFRHDFSAEKMVAGYEEIYRKFARNTSV